MRGVRRPARDRFLNLAACSDSVNKLAIAVPFDSIAFTVLSPRESASKPLVLCPNLSQIFGVQFRAEGTLAKRIPEKTLFTQTMRRNPNLSDKCLTSGIASRSQHQKRRYSLGQRRKEAARVEL
jgi:hypothetical protein